MADYTFISDFPIDEKVKYDTIVDEFENGAEQRRSRRAGSIRRWKLDYKARTTAEKDAVKNFFDSKKGRLSTFTFNNPNDGIDYTVRFDMDEFNPRKIGPSVFSFEVTLVQVL